ncbi:MAG: prefoldin subunit alpha [Candidatus Thermoplasmatota archaeon]|jgi:prefoldin alpha subunit|nr:prefoldin subunit alpha [Candidatus Thermoplasmatota archaeon]
MENNNQIEQEIEFLESFINASEKQITILTQGMEDYGKALAILQSKEIDQASETLISLGGGVFSKGRIEKNGSVLVAIGSDVFIEEESSSTELRLRSLIDEVRSSIDNLNKQRADAVRRYQAIISAINNSRKEQDVTKR